LNGDGGPAIDAALGPGCDGGAPQGFPFQPAVNEGGLFDTWPVRTVDSQTIEDILATWKLSIEGMVKTPRVLTFFDLLCLLRQDQITDFHCVEGWSIRDVPWNGVHLSTLLALAEPLATATHVTFHTIDERYNESLPIPVALEPKTLLAYGVAGSTLPLQRGFPVRTVVPRLFGYKSAKYVERIELTDHPIEGYWVAAGYGYDAEVQPERLRPGKY
jgi:DMSO/TMAO reductase YedYZ molybdopterin-dependent catalytic subunit